MSSLTCWVATYPMVGGRGQSKPLCGIARLNRHCLTLALVVALVGCAIANRAPELTPPILISESTWRQVDSDIVAASRAAAEPAKSHARDAMASWRELIRRRTETDFVPWFTGYWTQQWLSMKVAWYKLSAGKEAAPTEDRLATYLQEQYRDRVLKPVAKEIDPDLVMQQAMKAYVLLLGEQLEGIPRRYGLPLEQFDRRLKGIPAITLAPPAAHNASLYQIVHADPIERLPAYEALLDRLRNTAGGAAGGASDTGISSLAKRTSKKLVSELATSGVASAAAALAGRAAGMLISLGAAGFSAMLRENDRPEMEVQLRQNLSITFDEEWLSLMENPATGVLAGVYYLSGKIEGSLGNSDRLPVKFESPPREAHLPGEQPLQGGSGVYDAPGDYWRTEE